MPAPPNKKKRIQISLTITGSISKYLARPPQTPVYYDWFLGELQVVPKIANISSMATFITTSAGFYCQMIYFYLRYVCLLTQA
jgi:hypothetical protein